MRYKSENSGAVLDTKTGLREWFESHAEAIRVAGIRNAIEHEDDLEHIEGQLEDREREG